MGLKPIIVSVCIAAVIVACRPDPAAITPVPEFTPLAIEVPAGFPPLVQPENNIATSARVALGKKLFFDPRLSADGSVSCASCHLPDHAFADSEPVSIGVEGRTGFRNSPTLANIAWHPLLFMDGGVPTLELQILAPFDEHSEFDFPIIEAAELLQSDDEIVTMSMRAYGRNPDPFVITRSIAAFERTLISANSPYDRYLAGDASAMTSQAIEGMNLFFSNEIGCGSCHHGPLLTNFSFENIGLYDEYADEGRERVTAQPNDNGKFKVPTLRNVAVTAPYMHDGSLSDLEAVINHFDSGGSNHPLKHPAVRPLNLSANQREALLAFLHALTDETFINNPEHQP